MGTRHCIIVIKDQKPKIAQYGQFDGYPSGRGNDVLNFLTHCDLQYFSSVLDEVCFVTESEADKIDNTLAKVSESHFKKYYPQFHRNTSADILRLVYSREVYLLSNYYEFAYDSLFCEWCYVIDLDKHLFEIYKGFQKSKLNTNERFYRDDPDSGGYYGVKLVKYYSLDQLPTEIQFLSDLIKSDDE